MCQSSNKGGMLDLIICLNFLMPLFDRKLICVTPPGNCPMSENYFSKYERWTSEVLIPQGKSMWPMNQGKLAAQGRTHSRHSGMSHRTSGLSHDQKRWMNKARVPFIVSIHATSLGLFPHRLMGPVVVKDKGQSLQHPKGCPLTEEAPTRRGGLGVWEPPLGKWARHSEGQHQWSLLGERPGIWEHGYVETHIVATLAGEAGWTRCQRTYSQENRGEQVWDLVLEEVEYLVF